MNKLLLLTLLLLPALTGCHHYETRMYDITVHNLTPTPITIWLTKDGDPYENAWLSPEDLAVESPKGPAANRISGIVVPPGRTAFEGPIQGRFEPSTNAILRVYAGQLSFSQLLASSPTTGGRNDVEIPPGRTEYNVTGNGTDVHVNETQP